ncbi:hypothetical protein GYMLUDRAFT_43191 [Collybiopsis luxurians FD-317 M1]|uniref:Unplaced genomic scaffold GYMLUscaffold_24, whole genome shotgun sequence n=1 Tax=Collybiopsis luxurians FD-317 M1 TaxID=944289 RepID=A0A0D0CQ31_9AGAR|nr:hypothetical protein GYMLUDRAFT_43191 [Collybiopsis luxurians FD-317 M1]
MSDDSALTSKTVRDLEEWSTPERRRGDQLLDPIPIEIYLKILSEIYYRKDWNSLSLVCRFFASVTIPKILSQIAIRFKYEPSSKTWIESHTEFCHVLREGNDQLAVSLCRYIRECMIYSETPEHATISLFDSYMKDLLIMRNLNTLDLIHLDLSPAVLENISQLPALTSLKFARCKVGENLSNSDIMAAAACLHLQSFTLIELWNPRLTGPECEDFVPLAATSHLKWLRTDSLDFLECLASHHAVPPLYNLNLTQIDDFQHLFEHLSKFSTLVELDLEEVGWPWAPEAQGVIGLSTAEVPFRTEVDFAFPLSKLPCLKRLHCPPHFAYLFAGPHCLEEISLGNWLLRDELYEQDLVNDDDMRLSAGMRLLFDSPNANLRRLIDLPSGLVEGQPGESWHGKMQHWFPQLECLELVFTVVTPKDDGDANEEGRDPDFRDYQEQLEKSFTSFANTWGPLKTVKEMQIEIFDERVNNVSINEQWFKELASRLDLKNIFPNLSRLIFGDIEYPASN